MLAEARRQRGSPSGVKVLIDSKKPKSAKPDSGLHTLEFCLNCPDPHLEGTQTVALGAVHGPVEYRVSGELVMMVPNDIAGARLLNVEELVGRVALVDRGVVPLVDKVLAAQKAGAIGVVIADDGNCTELYECGRVGSPKLGGFGSRDPWHLWMKVEIPALLVMADVGDRLKKMMKLERIFIPGIGEQWAPSMR